LLRVFFYWWKKPADLEKITYLPCRNGFNNNKIPDTLLEQFKNPIEKL
jgi:hypothetical protein